MNVLTESNVAQFFSPDLSLLDRGRNHVKSNHVKSFHKTETVIDGEVEPSWGKVKNKTEEVTYKVTINYDNNSIQSGYCSCPNGNFLCSHQAAILLFARDYLSKTDYQCSWKRPRNINSTANCVSKTWPQKNYKALQSEMTTGDWDVVRAKVDPEKCFGLSWFLTLKENRQTQKYYIPSLLSSYVFDGAQNKNDWLLFKLKLTNLEIEEICEVTKGQRSNATWLQLRVHRLTASLFHIILTQIKRNSYPASFWKTLSGAYNLQGVKSIEYGIEHEEDAILEYEKLKGVKVQQVGIYISKCGLLGASPDGRVDSNKIIECKCSYSIRKMTLQEVLKYPPLFVEQVNGTVKLKSSCPYTDQIQGQLFLSNAEECDLIIWSNTWSPKIIVVTIQKDSNWEPNLLKLQQFYIDHYIKKSFDL